MSPHQSEITRAFSTVFDGQVRTIEGEEFHISLTIDARPFCINTPRSIPLAYCDKLKLELDLLLSQNVITSVTEATVWYAPIIVTPKKNTNRIHSYIGWPFWPQPARDKGTLPVTNPYSGSCRHCHTVLDALKGYRQCPLELTLIFSAMLQMTVAAMDTTHWTYSLTIF